MLGLVLVATCGLLVVQVLYDDFRNLRELGARGWIFWEYLGVTMPSFFAAVLPMALLISLLYVLGKLHRANELTAMRAAGVGFTRLTAPVWVVGFFFCGAVWWLNTTIVPWSVERSRTLREELQFRHDQRVLAMPEDRIGATYSVGFDNRAAGRMWFINRFSRKTQHAYGISVSVLDPKRHETSRIVASEGWRDEAQKGWVFRRGRELTFSPETGEMTASQYFDEKLMFGYREDPQLMLLIDQRPADLSLHELSRLIDYLEAERSPKAIQYAVRYFGLIADTLQPLLVIAMAIPFAVTGVRVNPAVGVSKSIGLFVLYYLFSNLAGSLATKEIVDPELAAWLPNIGMAAIALWLFSRVR